MESDRFWALRDGAYGEQKAVYALVGDGRATRKPRYATQRLICFVVVVVVIRCRPSRVVLVFGAS